MSVTPRGTGVGTLYPPVILANGSTSTVIASGPGGTLVGWEACNPNGNACAFRLHDGVTTGGSIAGASQPLGAEVIMLASTSTFRWYGPQGVPVASCVGVEYISGGCEITIYGQ